MRVSYSSLSTFKQCPYRFKLQYIDGLEPVPDYDPQDALILGTALHLAMELDEDAAVEWYFAQYPAITDLHVNEEIKIRHYAKLVKDQIPDGDHEVVLKHDGDYKGTIDLVIHNEDGTVDLLDLKYANPNSVDRYKESAQLPLYAYWYEKIYDVKVRKLLYALAPKVLIRQKKTETLEQFRARLRDTLKEKDLIHFEVPFDLTKVIDHTMIATEILQETEFPKNPSRLCDWCPFQQHCEQGVDLMAITLPKKERRNLGAENSKKKIWIYGAPFSGKTTLANEFPDPIMLNTDGNIKYVDAPYIHIKDDVQVEGRITKRTFAWEVLKDAIAELEKGSEFKTVVVDLVEDLHEMARLFVLDANGWEHETDGGFGAGWKKVESEFLSTMKRLLNLDYNIVLISHEDTTKDITRRGGDKITSVKPNLSEKLANKLAGMVDVVARAVVIDGEHQLSFKTDEVQFGGGRLKIEQDKLSLTYDDLISIYGGQTAEKPAKVETANETPKTEEPAEEEPQDETPRPRRTRKVRD